MQIEAYAVLNSGGKAQPFSYEKKVGKKDVLNTDPAADIDARVVEVKIALSPEDSNKVSGLTYAKVLVDINNQPNSN